MHRLQISVLFNPLPEAAISKFSKKGIDLCFKDVHSPFLLLQALIFHFEKKQKGNSQGITRCWEEFFEWMPNPWRCAKAPRHEVEASYCKMHQLEYSTVVSAASDVSGKSATSASFAAPRLSFVSFSSSCRMSLLSSLSFTCTQLFENKNEQEKSLM